MRLSTSMQRGIIETGVGGILNKFIVKNRRITLFFEDIITGYITTCEQHGFSKDISKHAERWGGLTFKTLIPTPVKKLPNILIDQFLKKVWTNLGIVDDIHLDKKGDIICLTTKNESITRIIGKNDFMPGFFNGVVTGMYGSQSEIIDVLQSKELCEYQFKLTHETINIIGRDKSLYNKLNYSEPLNGFTLNDVLRKGIFQLKEGNKVYFREKRITITENTIFHLVGAANLLLDEVPGISYDFFSEIIKKESTDEQKITLLKNLLQIMGWGIVNIIVKNKNEIFVGIRNPPYGLQLEKDNWTVLGKVILGYLWLINKDLEISDFNEGYKCLKIMYLTK